MATTCLQRLNIYFTMAKKKLTPMVTQNTLQIMIKYTLILSILNEYVS